MEKGYLATVTGGNPHQVDGFIHVPERLPLKVISWC